METIYWELDHFRCSPELDKLHWDALIEKRIEITRALKELGFDLHTYKVDIQQIEVGHRGCWFPITDEGTGFNICLHLLGFMFVGGLAVKESSLYGCLHPFLLQVLKRSSQPPAITSCAYLSDSKFLRCAAHPGRLDCDGCGDYVVTDKVQPSLVWV